MNKSIAIAIIAALSLPLAPAHGHGGGLDSQGGHYNRKTGEYHYHRKTTPAPQPRQSNVLRVVDEEDSSPKTDAQIKRILINQSLAAYSGNCPCPYNTDRAGRSCGKRSAYSRPGGASPLCYASDVSEEMVEDYRVRFGVESPPTTEEGGVREGLTP